MKLRESDVAVVTGAASGIGFALAREFADRGMSVVLADVEDESLERAVHELPRAGDRTVAVRTDVSDPTQVEALARHALDRFGRVDVVCNNAGVSLRTRVPSWEVEANDWTWILGVNLWGVVHGIDTFAPLLVEQGRGHIVNVASMAGISTVPYVAPYTVAKHAVVGLSEALADELAQIAPDVHVTVVSPGPVSTRIRDSDRNRPSHLASSSQSAPRRTEAKPFAMDAAEVAKATVAGVEADRLHVAPSADSLPRVRARIDRLLRDIEPVPD